MEDDVKRAVEGIEKRAEREVSDVRYEAETMMKAISTALEAEIREVRDKARKDMQT